MTNDTPVLELQSVDKHFDTSSGLVDTLRNWVSGEGPSLVRAVDDVNLELEENQVQGVIGESGCGKTTLLRTIIGLYDPTGGELRFKGQSTTDFSKEEWKEFRRQVQLVFQDPFNSLDPKFSVRRTVAEPLKIHGIDYDRSDIEEMLERVGLTPASQYIQQFPDQLSGGEKQRVAIARALITEPDIILADEPASMLDVSTQAEILNLLSRLTSEFGVSMIYISHDLSTVSYVCDEINVMYLGRIVEKAPTREILSEPKHPYTKALIQSIPIPDPHHERERAAIGGEPGDPIDMPTGCRFKNRCPDQMAVCDNTPRDVDVNGSSAHTVACHLYYDHEATEEGSDDLTTMSSIEETA